MTGSAAYRHEAYARALQQGDAACFANAGGWWIKRRIPGTSLFDGAGPYPLLVCVDWSGLAADLAGVADDIVSFAAVVDPLGDFDEAMLRRAFPDVLFPYKQHYTVDLTRPLEQTVSKHHKYYARRALRDFRVEHCEDPVRYRDTWVALYSELVGRHEITGPAAFSPGSLAAQLAVPGMQVFLAYDGDEIAGIQLWAVQGSAVHHHLSAYSTRGYAMRVSYAMVWKAMENLQAAGVQLASLGAGAGINSNSGGLTEFKAGWSDGQRTAWFGGRVFDRERYRQLSAEVPPDTPFFPLYRAAQVR
mgnify:FL=1